MSVSQIRDDEHDKRAELNEAEQHYVEACADVDLCVAALERTEAELAAAKRVRSDAAALYRAAFAEFYGVDLPVVAV